MTTSPDNNFRVKITAVKNYGTNPKFTFQHSSKSSLTKQYSTSQYLFAIDSSLRPASQGFKRDLWDKADFKVTGKVRCGRVN